MICSLTTAPDGQWAAMRVDRQVSLLATGAAPAVGSFELDSDDADLALIHGPPNVLIAATRRGGATRIALHYPPKLEVTARIELAYDTRIAAVCDGRLVLVSSDHKQLAIVRANGRGLASHAVELQHSRIELVAGIERNQLIVGQPRRLEVWDAVSARPLRKLALELPSLPRTVGTAAGHLWVTRPGSHEVIVYRLSDGRPFQYDLGAPIEQVIAHPKSPLIVVVTSRGLARLHCLAHSVTPIESLWQPNTALAQLVIGDAISLLGTVDGTPPWRVSLSKIAGR